MNSNNLSVWQHLIEREQRGRRRPAKYRHYLVMSDELLCEIANNRAVEIRNLLSDESAWFEFEDGQVTISFIHYFVIDEVHFRILNYLIQKELGTVPVRRGGNMD